MRVLLIEDDSATAQGIELMLKTEGFNVYTTDLGEEGVDLGKLYDYDIILLDLNCRTCRVLTYSRHCVWPRSTRQSLSCQVQMTLTARFAVSAQALTTI